MWLLYFFVWSVCVTEHETECQDAQYPFRLPGEVIPSQYDLKLLFDSENVDSGFNYYGAVDILLRAVETTTKIVLNSNGINYLKKDLKLIMNTADNVPNNEIEVESTNIDEENQFYILNLKRPMEINVIYSLSIPFVGGLYLGKESGVYVTSHVLNDSSRTYFDDAERFAISTRFEPVGARTLFPCFDEPQYRAVFNIIIGHHKDLKAISNMPLTATTTDESMDPHVNWTVIENSWGKSRDVFVWDHFEKTGSISTYLVGFLISKYENENANHPITKVAVWTRPIEKLDAQNTDKPEVFATEMASKVLSYYENYFDMPCEMPKIDHVFQNSYENTFSTNWGLINYSDLNYPENIAKRPSFLARAIFTQAMSKGMALQWLGNTLKWWNDQWLKEGLALFLAHQSLATLLIQDKLLQTVLLLAPLNEYLQENALDSTIAIQTPMELTHPKLINDHTRRIQHIKAAFLFRMVHRLVGDDIFKDAVHNFLVKYSSKNTNPDYLYEEMYKSRFNLGDKMGNVSEKMIMDSWTNQPGYPLVTVTRDYDKGSFIFTQRRYMSHEDGSRPSSQGWWIPFRILTQNDKHPSPFDLLADNEGLNNSAYYHHGATVDAWLLFNADMIAPCRVNYDSRNWALLAATLGTAENRSMIPALNRAQLLADAYELTKSGYMEFDLPFKLTSYLVYENNPDVLEHGLNQFDTIGLMLTRTPEYEKYMETVQGILTIQQKHLGVGGAYLCMYLSNQLKSLDYKELRLCLVLYEWWCKLKSDVHVSLLLKLFKEWQVESAEKFAIAPHLRKFMFCVGIERGGQEEWEFLLSELDRVSIAGIPTKAEVIYGLACSREPYLLYRTLKMLVEGRFCIAPDVDDVIRTIFRNPVGYYVGQEFIYKRSRQVFEGYSAQVTTLALITHLLAQIRDESDLVEFSEWRDKHMDSLVKLNINTSVHVAYETARRNVAWLNRKLPSILDQFELYLEDQFGGPRRPPTGYLRMGLKSRYRSSNSNKIVVTKLCCFLSLFCYIFRAN